MNRSGLLTCPHRQSEAEAGPHPLPLPVQGRPCRHPVAARGVPPGGHHLKTEITTSQRPVYIIQYTDIFLS